MIKNRGRYLDDRRIRVLGILLIAYLCMSFLIGAISPSDASPDNAGRGSYEIDTAKLTEMQSLYELFCPAFQYSHDELSPLGPIDKPRYRQRADGIYRSKTVSHDGIASIVLTGDLMCQTRQQQAALAGSGEYDFSDGFCLERGIFRKADFVIGNLETNLSESASYMSEEKAIGGLPHLNAPSTYLDALRYAYFDMLSTANNHNCDCGLRGIFETLGHLDQYGFIHTGTFRDASEPRFVIVEIDGIRVGFLSYSTIYNGKDQYLSEAGRGIFLNPYSAERVAQDVTAAREAGAEYIIAYNHWGREFRTKKTGKQTAIAQEMADAGVDYIVGSHPHVLEPYGTVQAADGRTVPVIYSMGNHVSHMNQMDECRDAIILNIDLARDEDGGIYIAGQSYIPCYCATEYSGHNYTVVPLNKRRRTVTSMKDEFSASYQRICETIGTELRIMDAYK